jgi:hypothetical protein
LSWKRTITWWPKHEQHDPTTFGDDLSPADNGYRLKKIHDEAAFGENEEGVNTVIEVSYESAWTTIDGDECPQSCGFSILHNCNRDDEEYLAEDGFKTMDEATAAVEMALVQILTRN